MSHILFILFETQFTVFKAFESEVFLFRARLVFKIYFLSFLFRILMQIRLKKGENVTRGRGGGKKGEKKCHVFFEWPLRIMFRCYSNILNVHN
jgi:hypothetical protein